MELTSDVTAAPPVRPRGLSPARTYWVSFGLLAALMVLWAVANPPMAAPDENAHVVKAAAVVRGELHGRSAPDNPGSGLVDVPELFAYSMSMPNCFAFNPTATAACIPAPPDDLTTQTQTPTWVVRNNPLYYWIVGLPSFFPDGIWVFYAMRVVSALLCAAVLAWGVRCVAEVRESRFVGLGLLAATTPMVLFLGSAVNSSSLEITAAISLWVALLVLLRHPDPARLRVRMAGIATLSVVLANSRGLSPLVLGVIALTAIAISPWRNTLAVLRDRRSWPWFAVIGAGLVASLAWIATAGTLGGGSTGGTGVTFRASLRATVEQTPAYLQAALGHFGWLDTHLPVWTYMLLSLGVLAVPVLALLAHGRRADGVAVVAVGAIALGLPVLIQAWQAGSVGQIWTGRYSMPFLVGLPIAAGFVVRDGVLPARFRARGFFVTVASVLGVGQVVAFAINLHRYMRGTNVGWFVPFPGEWEPPVNAVVLTVAFAVAYAGFVIVLDRLARRPGEADTPAVAERPAAPVATVAPGAAA